MMKKYLVTIFEALKSGSKALQQQMLMVEEQTRSSRQSSIAENSAGIASQRDLPAGNSL
jgi:hypothetical protein